MAAGEPDISTESDDADESDQDSSAGKLVPSYLPDGSRDSRSDQDNESEMGKVPLSRKRVEWETVETWDRQQYEDGHIRGCILNNAQQFMRAAGLSFVAGQKKKDTNLDCWTLRSKKPDKDRINEVNI